jgi:CRISPR-associated endonuclease/helicase Cas3
VAPVHAALAAYDSLIILDEAHCAQPFMQTVSSVRDYLDSDRWSSGKIPIAPPLSLVVMSATAPLADAAGNPLKRFPSSQQERTAALDDPEITKRSAAVKSTRIELIDHGGDAAVVKRVSALAREAISRGCKRIAVMVNRVGLAHDSAAATRETRGFPPCDVVLMTGRMRPIDRDDLVNRWKRFLRASGPDEPSRPIVVVTTQCLEVGADFSFDYLVTQCASIDALLQRFGRLDRLGGIGRTHAAILTTNNEISESADDPIYGKGIAETWKWLEAQAGGSSASGEINFAISAIGENTRSLDAEVRSAMLAPHPSAPVLMPSHVDILCQTSPHPEPDVDVAAYLHGVGRGQAEVRVAFRVDIAGADGSLVGDGESGAAYSRLFDLCPPARQEFLTVPIFRLKTYLLNPAAATVMAGDQDVEGAARAEVPKLNGGATGARQFLRCRDGEWELLTAVESRDLIRPNDLVLLGAQPGNPIPPALGTNCDGVPIDRAEEAAWIAQPQHDARRGGGIFLRVSRSVLQQEPLSSASQPLLDWLRDNPTGTEADFPEVNSLRTALEAAAKAVGTTHEAALFRFRRVCEFIGGAIKPKYIEPHPIEKESWIISIPGKTSEIDDSVGDEDAASVSSRSVLLADHLADVRTVIGKFAHGLPPELGTVLKQAGEWHDLGKLDPRFQETLCNANIQPVAKSETWSGRKADFRHEMISLQIVQNCLAEQLPTGDIQRELLLHLIAAHHGHARPFAPVREDSEPVDILAPAGFAPPVKLTTEVRRRFPKPHRLGSGIPDRFWFLTRHFGWWGLAYLEALVRLADWRASANPTGGEQQDMETRT